MSKQKQMSEAAARKHLPFKVAPKRKTVELGNETIGILEMEVFGGLTNAEAIGLQRMVREKKFEEMSNMYKDKTEQEIRALVEESIQSTEVAGFMLNYTAELATLIVQSRLDSSWTYDDTIRLPQALVNELANFMQSEMDASKPKTDEEDEDLPNAK